MDKFRQTSDERMLGAREQADSCLWKFFFPVLKMGRGHDLVVAAVIEDDGPDRR